MTGRRVIGRVLAWEPAWVWLGVFVVLFAGQYLASHAEPRPEYSDQLLSGWFRYDGPQYTYLATTGYGVTPEGLPLMAWFPAYPLAIRALAPVVGDPVVAGVAISALCGFVAFQLLWRWTGAAGLSSPARLTTLGCAALYPYGWFLFGPVYADSMFLMFALGAFCLLEADRPAAAGLCGAVATATRVNGVALVAGLGLLALERAEVLIPSTTARGFVARFRIPMVVCRRRWSGRSLWVLVSAGGLVAYSVYLWLRWNDPLAFVRAQRFWHHGPGGGWQVWLKVDLLGGLVKWTNPSITLTSAAQGVLWAAALVACPFVGRRFGWGYAVYIGISLVMIGASSRDFLGAGRYLLSAFPLAALAGEWLSGRTRWRWGILAGAGCLLVFLNAAFARNAYLT